MRHHFTMLVTIIMDLALPSITLTKHIVTHHVRTEMVTHHFTLLVTMNCPKIVQYLLSTGKVDPEAKNKEGKTPLDFATQKQKQ